MKGNLDELKLAEPETRKGNFKFVLTCRGYGWRGVPIPTNWRNKLNPTSGRVLPSPKCGIKNEVKPIWIRAIWKYNLKKNF